MPRVTYIHPQGWEKTIEVPVGTTVMLGAVSNDIDGIVAECGGSCICGTCHVYVDDAFLPELPPVSAPEDETLDSVASERQHNSRLGCQLVMTSALDGLIVRLPERQR
jgi:2Fe-2S ferredoxin